MSMLAGFIRGLAILWPFFKEMVIKNTSLREAIRKNRTVSILFFFLIIALGCTFQLASMVMSEHQRARVQLDGQHGLENQLTLSDQQLETVKAQLERRDATIDVLNGDISYWRGVVDVRDEQLEQLRNDLRASQERILDLENLVGTLREKQRLKELKAQTLDTPSRRDIQSKLNSLKARELELSQ